MSVFYHLTGWRGLIGQAGFDAMKTAPLGTDLRDLAEPGAILDAGIRPMQDRLWPDLPPCV